MDPRNTPEYRLHCALSELDDIQLDELEDADRVRIETAITLLDETSLLTRSASRSLSTSSDDSSVD